MFKVLIVEDSAPVREAVAALLQARFSHIAVEQAETGREALNKCERWQPDLILMDIKLRGDNGLELTRRIRSRLGDDPPVVVILSCHDLPEYRAAALRNGAHYFLSKETVTSRELVRLVDKIYRGRRS